MALKIDNAALTSINAADAFFTEPAAAPQEPAAEALAPAKKNSRSARLNLLLSISNKIKLQKMIEREGYKSVNDYINYLIAVAVKDEPEPTAAEIKAYKKEAQARKQS